MNPKERFMRHHFHGLCIDHLCPREGIRDQLGRFLGRCDALTRTGEKPTKHASVQDMVELHHFAGLLKVRR